MDQTNAVPASRRVFISHSSSDVADASALVAALEEHGFQCWVAPRNIPPGSRYGEAIIDGINACPLFVLLLSERSNASPQVLAEVERAVSKGRSLVTVRLEDATLSKSLEYFLSSFHWIDAYSPLEAHRERLVAAVRQCADGRTEALPGRIAVPETPNNLPHQLTSFVGREREVAEIAERLETARLLTLTGPGGTGKTRLSLHVAKDQSKTDGVWFVELASLADPALVTQTVASALDVREEAGTPLVKTLGGALKTKSLLLILDNCEHVLSSCATLAAELTRACPGVQILASSREPLGLPGEQIYRVPSLSLPDLNQVATAASLAQSESVRLFTERAQAARPDFAVTDANAPAVAHVCHRLDGIPLALELAAARVRSLSVEDVNTRLDNRFRLLTGGSKTLLPRQQTLKALIDWSYDLLTDQEKTLLMRLSVFAGGWNLAAAEGVCTGEELEDWEILDVLTALVDKSLVVYAEMGGVGRYRLLETVRQYADERLTESGGKAGAQDRHRDFFAAQAEEAASHFWAADQGQWLSRVDGEHDNLREALAWCDEASRAMTEEGAAQADAWLRLGGSLLRFWELRGYFAEGSDWMGRALDRTEGRPASLLRAKVCLGAGSLANAQGDYEKSRTLYEKSLELFRQMGDQRGIARALNNLGLSAQDRGDHAEARRLFEQSLALKRQFGDPGGIANSLMNLGISANAQGDYAAARALYEQCLELFRQVEDQSSIANALINLGEVALLLGEYENARALYTQSLEVTRAIGDQLGIAYGLMGVGEATAGIGKYDDACALCEQGIDLFRRLGDQQGAARSLGAMGVLVQTHGDDAAARALFVQCLGECRVIGDQLGIAFSLEGLAFVAASHGEAARAARWWAAADAYRTRCGTPLPPIRAARQARALADARQILGDDVFAAMWNEGLAMTLEQAAEYANDKGSRESSD